MPEDTRNPVEDTVAGTSRKASSSPGRMHPVVAVPAADIPRGYRAGLHRAVPVHVQQERRESHKEVASVEERADMLRRAPEAAPVPVDTEEAEPSPHPPAARSAFPSGAPARPGRLAAARGVEDTPVWLQSPPVDRLPMTLPRLPDPFACAVPYGFPCSPCVFPYARITTFLTSIVFTVGTFFPLSPRCRGVLLMLQLSRGAVVHLL